MTRLPALMTILLLATGVRAADSPARDDDSTRATARPANPAADPAATSDCTPRGELRADPGRGRALHAEHCAECHGLDGKAEVIVLHMDTPPRDQSDAAYMKTLTDGYLYLAICRGGAGVGRNFVMPAWAGILGDQDMRDLIAWIRTFSGT